MTLRRTLLALGLAVMAVVGYRLVFSDERAVARRLEAAARSFETERLLELAGFFSRGYQDELGLDQAALLGLSQQAFAAWDELSVNFHASRAEIAGDRATVSVTFWISGRAGGERSAVAGSRSDPLSSTLVLGRERGDWRLLSATEPAATAR